MYYSSRQSIICNFKVFEKKQLFLGLAQSSSWKPQDLIFFYRLRQPQLEARAIPLSLGFECNSSLIPDKTTDQQGRYAG